MSTSNAALPSIPEKIIIGDHIKSNVIILIQQQTFMAHAIATSEQDPSRRIRLILSALQRFPCFAG